MNAKLVWIPTVKQEGRGSISIAEYGNESVLPFLPKRVFYIYDAPARTVRGGHGHKTCEQFFIATSGVVTVNVGSESFILGMADLGLYVPAGNLVMFEFASEKAVLVVLASELYDKDDYIYPEGTDGR